MRAIILGAAALVIATQAGAQQQDFSKVAVSRAESGALNGGVRDQ